VPGALDRRLRSEIARYGIHACTFEILEVLEPTETATRPTSTATSTPPRPSGANDSRPADLY